MTTDWTFQESLFAGTPVLAEKTIIDIQERAYDHGVAARVMPDGTLVIAADDETGKPGITVSKGTGGDDGRGWYVGGEYYRTAREAYRAACGIIERLAA
jgi:hypothetical protein